MKVLLAAGGTAGHINPALATAGEIRKRHPEVEILFIGTKDKMEAKLVPQAGFDFKSIEISGFWRSFDFESIKHNLSTVKKLKKSMSDSKKIIKEFKPDVVVGFGGYVSGPVLTEAVKLGIPTAIHEQNAFPGVTNKALAKKVDAVMLTSKNAAKYMQCKNEPIVTGLPVRGEMLSADRTAARKSFGLDDSRIMVLSMGGSLGADTINETVLELIKNFGDNKQFYFLHSTGASGVWFKEKLEKESPDLNFDNIEIREYINDMDVCMAAADLVICRAGASSLSEVQAMGKPSILIPSPNVAENHQYYNALSLVENGAAEVIEEKDLTFDAFKEIFLKMTSSKEVLSAYAQNAKNMAITDAKDKITQIVLSLIKS